MKNYQLIIKKLNFFFKNINKEKALRIEYEKLLLSKNIDIEKIKEVS